MNLNPLVLLEKAINEHGSSVIMKEHLALVKEMLTKVEKEKSDLEKELVSAREEITELKAKIPNTKFVEYRGVKFKRKPSGGFEKSVYCLSCEVGMVSIPDEDTPFVCGKCHSASGFQSQELASILKEVESEYP